ncbi:MAG: iron-containing alcohol dehydrogenase, partial [Acutalibacteraceae bacterium]
LANLVSDLHLFKPDSIVAVPQIVKKLMYGAIKFAASKPELSEEKAVNMFLGGNIIDIISGGAPLEAAANARFNDTGILVLNGYGMTECAPIISNNAVGCYRHGSVGKPIPCMQVKIENGEILVKGPSVMLGYYKNPEATKEAFTDDGFLHTGDLGHFDDDGFLYITGRCKNLILLENGENVSAEMLEEQFANEPAVQEVICYGENGAICAEVYLNKAFLQEHGITDESEAMTDILMRVNEKLASFQRISTFKIRPVPFERTSSSKIKRSSKMSAVKKEIIEPSTDTEIKVCRAVKELLMLPEVSVTDNFFAIGGDSLNAMELAVSLNISAQLIYDKPFLNMLAEEIDSAEKSSSDKIDNVNEIINNTAHKGERHEKYKCALITGATGFLGVHILKKLIENGIETYCLVRSREKLDTQLEYYFGEFTSPLIHAVSGDIEKPKLGLSDEKYLELSKKVDVVFHVAANVHHAGDYGDLERTNVTGTSNVIDFAKSANAVLQHTSTVSVHGAATVKQTKCKSVFDENVLDIGQRYSDNVYIHSKYCAEQLVLLARESGLEANIFRIGNLTWRTSDGKFQKNIDDNGFLRRVHAMLKLGMLNENMDKYPTDLTAVDECADAYVRLALNGKVNEIYHMYNPNFLKTEDMFKFLDVPYRRVSTQETVETVFANTDDRDIHVYMFYLIISGRSANIEMNNDYTVRKLSESGFKWSSPDKAYLTVSDSAERPDGHCLDFVPCKLKPMRKTGGVLNPIQKLTLGVMHDAKFIESVLLHGDNALDELQTEIKKAGVQKPMFITYQGAENNKKISAFISSVSDSPVIFSEISAEPTTENTDNALEAYFAGGCDGLVAIGGGSVLDTAKITALRAANPEEEIDDICKIDSLASACVPLFAVPTTSGTGSEVTAFAVITDTDENKKKPFVSDRF